MDSTFGNPKFETGEFDHLLLSPRNESLSNNSYQRVARPRRRIDEEAAKDANAPLDFDRPHPRVLAALAADKRMKEAAREASKEADKELKKQQTTADEKKQGKLPRPRAQAPAPESEASTARGEETGESSGAGLKAKAKRSVRSKKRKDSKEGMAKSGRQQSHASAEA